MRFFCVDSGGVIVKTGECQPGALAMQADAGTTAHEGIADPWTQYWDGAALRDYPRALAVERRNFRPGFRWTTDGWVDERPLDMAKQQKWTEIKRARSSAEAAGFTAGGYPWDSDTDSQQALALALQDMASAGGPATVDWTTADDQVVSLTLAQMRGLVRALRNHIQQQRDRATTLRGQIAAATTLAEVDAIQW